MVPFATMEEATAWLNIAQTWFDAVPPDGGHVWARYDPEALHTDAGAEQTARRPQDILI